MTLLVVFISFSYFLQSSLENITHPQSSAPGAQPEFERMTFIKLSAELPGLSVKIDLCFTVSLLPCSHPIPHCIVNLSSQSFQQ